MTNSHNISRIKDWFQRISYVFLIGSFIGFVTEGFYGLITTGSFAINRGMIYGPFNQVYGFGAVLFTVCLYHFRKIKPIIIFLISSILGAVFEYLCSYIQETVFCSNSWEYNDIAFNFNGRTSLLHAIFWGLLGVSFICWVFPPIEKLIEKIPSKFRFSIAVILLVFMILNMTISAFAVFRWTERLNDIPAKNTVDVFLDKHYDNDRMEKVYSNMNFDI